LVLRYHLYNCVITNLKVLDLLIYFRNEKPKMRFI